MKRKFKVQVERNDEYIIELDDEVLNEEWQKHFNRYFYEFDGLEEHAEHLAQHKARFNQRFIEGYGNVLINGNSAHGTPPEDINLAVNITVISEDDDIDVWVSELE